MFHLVCDLNKDGQISNAGTLTTPPETWSAPALKLRLAIFSAGPDGDPATWEDNIPPNFSESH